MTEMASFWPLGKRGSKAKVRAEAGDDSNGHVSTKDDGQTKKKKLFSRSWFSNRLFHRDRKRGSLDLAEAGTVSAAETVRQSFCLNNSFSAKSAFKGRSRLISNMATLESV